MKNKATYLIEKTISEKENGITTERRIYFECFMFGIACFGAREQAKIFCEKEEAEQTMKKIGSNPKTIKIINY